MAAGGGGTMSAFRGTEGGSSGPARTLPIERPGGGGEVRTANSGHCMGTYPGLWPCAQPSQRKPLPA